MEPIVCDICGEPLSPDDDGWGEVPALCAECQAARREHDDPEEDETLPSTLRETLMKGQGTALWTDVLQHLDIPNRSWEDITELYCMIIDMAMEQGLYP
jgi:hypothetical protein